MFEHIFPSDFSKRFGSVYQPLPVATDPASWQENRQWETRLDGALNTYLSYINSAEQFATFDSRPTNFEALQLQLDIQYGDFLNILEELPEAFQKAVPEGGYFLEAPSSAWEEALANYRRGQFYTGASQYEQGVRNLLEMASGRIPSKSWRDLDRLYDRLMQEACLHTDLKLSLPQYQVPPHQRQRIEKTEAAAFRALNNLAEQFKPK